MDNSDDGFSDDGFDSLPAGTLIQLEQNAYQATQGVSGYNGSLQTTTRTVQECGSSHNGNQFLKPPPLPNQGLSREYRDLAIGDLDAQVFEENGTLEEPGSQRFSLGIQTGSAKTPAHATSDRLGGLHQDGENDSAREQQLRGSISEV